MSSSLRKTLRRRAVRKTVKRLSLEYLRVGLNRCNVDDSSNDTDDNDDEFDHYAVASDAEVHEVNDTIDEQLVVNDDVDQPIVNDALDLDLEDEHVQVHDSDSNVDSDSSDQVSSEEEGGPLQLRDESEKEQFGIDAIREWAQEPGLLSMSKLDQLLHRLSVVFTRMPFSYTTLFACDYVFDIIPFGADAEFWFNGDSFQP
ncbi:Halomucin [Frankliniella fusca]|uniref:Halomucin n=1 Tax=Frankliniella fusca TaxID=407009 RepID=A0AAE1LKN6_9NEOP|nr:Halomucin [Frankliniella fusca]